MRKLNNKELINLFQTLQLRELDLEERVIKWQRKLHVLNSSSIPVTDDEKEYTLLTLNSFIERREIITDLISWVKELMASSIN